MKRSVLIIAHDESSRIRECFESIAKQTEKPDEIVLVAHNCTDDTAEKARQAAEDFNMAGVRIDEFITERTWPVFARIRAFELASHEAVACIDGDCIADPDWFRTITAPLSSESVVGVGGKVRFIGDAFGNLASFWFFDVGGFLPWRHFYFWGANFACKKSAYLETGWLERAVALQESLGLHFWAEDCYLSLALERQWKVEYAPEAKVAAHPGLMENSIRRGVYQERDRLALFRHFGK